jgi:hypothetical protein
MKRHDGTPVPTVQPARTDIGNRTLLLKTKMPISANPKWGKKTGACQERQAPADIDSCFWDFG